MTKILIDGIHLGPEMKGVGRYVFRVIENFIPIEKSMQFYVIVKDNIPLLELAIDSCPYPKSILGTAKSDLSRYLLRFKGNE
jgi:hypothetical protein